jgi:transcriptional regulator with XRE-family HTH domain
MNRLRDLREDKDLTQNYIAKKFNIDQSNYSKIELEKIEIPIKLLKKLSEFYNTSTDYILGLTNEIKPYPKIKKNNDNF